MALIPLQMVHSFLASPNIYISLYTETVQLEHLFPVLHNQCKLQPLQT